MTDDAQGSKDAFDVNARVLSSQYIKLSNSRVIKRYKYTETI